MPQQPIGPTPPPSSADIAKRFGGVPTTADIAKQFGGAPAQSQPAAPTTPAEPAEPAFWQVLRQSMRQQAAQQFGAPELGDLTAGATKGAARTAIGLGELAHKVGMLGPSVPPALSDAAFGGMRQRVEPRTPGESVGRFAEQMAEFGLPAARAAELKAAVTTSSGLLRAMMNAGVEAGAATGVSAAQEGQLTVAPAVAGAVGSLALAPVGKSLTWLGERIEKSLVKATARDVQNGFQVGNIYKHQLGGTLSQTFDKSTSKLNDLGQQLKAELSKPGPGGTVPQVDVLGALADAAKELSANAGKTMGRNQAIERAVQNYLDDPAFISLVKNGTADLAVANQIKQGVGDLGAWASGARDLDANAAEIVANAFYSKLREAIEKSVPGGAGRVRELNKAMGEIIPIRQAIIRRIPVEQRSNVINLGDMIGLASNDIGIALANRLLRSGRMANISANAGNLIEGLRPSETGARIAAGLTSQVNRR